MFEINKEKYEIPAPCNGNRGKQVYPFADMQVGDSFDAPRDMGKCKYSDIRQSAISANARNFAKKHNPDAKFKTRLIDENTVRCWRVK